MNRRAEGDHLRMAGFGRFSRFVPVTGPLSDKKRWYRGFVALCNYLMRWLWRVFFMQIPKKVFGYKIPDITKRRRL